MELFSVRLDTVAEPIRLNGPLPAGGDVLFEVSRKGLIRRGRDSARSRA